MGIRTPGFWFRPPGLKGALLSPLGFACAGLGKIRKKITSPAQGSAPLVVVGNIVAGGAGKTPVVLSLAKSLKEKGIDVHLIAKGYGGEERGPLQVELNKHTAKEVGDEPLLLAETAPTWIARDRGAAWEEASKAGAEVIISDDGLQSPRLMPDFAIMVIDGVVGLGNQKLLPAGPLREKVSDALKRVNAIVQIGGNSPRIFATDSSKRSDFPTLYADYVTETADWLEGKRILAFAGLGRPEKFFAACLTSGANVVETMAFPDHHPYNAKDMRQIMSKAEELGTTPVTTAKDYVRIPQDFRPRIRVLNGELSWRDPAAIASLTADILERIKYRAGQS